MPGTTRVTLSGYECANDLLPPVCAACGRPGTDRVRMRFSWRPRWAEAVPVVDWYMTRRMTVRLPACPAHAWRWRWKNVFILISFLPIAGLVTGLYLLNLRQAPGVVQDGVTVGLLCSAGAALLVWAAVAVLLTQGIHPTEITDRSITLAEVHTAFLIALAEDRARSNDRLRASGYGDARDDYDDRPDEPGSGAETEGTA